MSCLLNAMENIRKIRIHYANQSGKSNTNTSRDLFFSTSDTGSDSSIDPGYQNYKRLRTQPDYAKYRLSVLQKLDLVVSLEVSQNQRKKKHMDASNLDENKLFRMFFTLNNIKRQ